MLNGLATPFMWAKQSAPRGVYLKNPQAGTRCPNPRGGKKERDMDSASSSAPTPDILESCREPINIEMGVPKYCDINSGPTDTTGVWYYDRSRWLSFSQERRSRKMAGTSIDPDGSKS